MWAGGAALAGAFVPCQRLQLGRKISSIALPSMVGHVGGVFGCLERDPKVNTCREPFRSIRCHQPGHRER
jgi:hypothetical protein